VSFYIKDITFFYDIGAPNFLGLDNLSQYSVGNTNHYYFLDQDHIDHETTGQERNRANFERIPDENLYIESFGLTSSRDEIADGAQPIHIEFINFD